MINLKTIIIIALIVLLNLEESYSATPIIQKVVPVANSIMVPIGKPAIEVSFTQPVEGVLSLSISPPVSFNTIYENCEELAYENAVYWQLPCYKIRLELLENLEADKWYIVTIEGANPAYSFSFKTGLDMILQRRTITNISIAGNLGTKSASCDKAIATVWVDPTTGVNLLVEDYDGNIMYQKIIDTNFYYSTSLTPSIDMSASCDMIIGYQNDWPTQYTLDIRIKTKIYRTLFYYNGKWNWSTIATMNYTNPWIYNDQLNHPDWANFSMLLDVGPVNVSMSQGGDALAVYQDPTCRYTGSTIKAPWMCDNMIRGLFFKKGYLGGSFLGKYMTNNFFWYHATWPVINSLPDADSSTWSVGCTGGGAYDNAYWPHGDIEGNYAVIKWTEFCGNVRDRYTTPDGDDQAFKVFDLNSCDPNGNGSCWGSPEYVLSDYYGGKYDEWGGECVIRQSDIGQSPELACTWMDRSQSYPNTSNIKGRVWSISGNSAIPVTVEKVINEHLPGDQINPGLIFSDDGIFFIWKQNSIMHTGGHSIMGRFTNSRLGFLTNDIKLNTGDNVASDWEDEGGENWNLCNNTHGEINVSRNPYGDYIFSWLAPNQVNPGTNISHGLGNKIILGKLFNCDVYEDIYLTESNTGPYESITEAYISSNYYDRMDIPAQTYSETILFNQSKDTILDIGGICNKTVTIETDRLEISEGIVTISGGNLIIKDAPFPVIILPPPGNDEDVIGQPVR